MSSSSSDELEMDWPESHQSVNTFTDRINRPSRLSLSIAIIAVVGGLWLLGAIFSPAANTKDIPSAVSAAVTPAVLPEHSMLDGDAPAAPRRQVLIKTTSTNDGGLGSVVAQLRSSAAIATMLGASFSTYGVISSHVSRRYRAASVMHIDLLESPLEVDAKVCSLMNLPGYGRALELMETWCNNTDANAYAVEMQGLFSGCGLILDNRPRDVRYDMSKCTWRWVKHVFSNIGLQTPRKGIGLHIRWGDMSVASFVGDPLTPQRSTPIDKAASMLRKIRECGIDDELSVYMEWHNDTMLRGLGEPYRIVDTGDSLEDLVDLAANRLMILDISSYTVLAHNIAAGGVTVVPDIDQFDITWDDNGVNSVLRWQELLDIPCSDFLPLYGL